MGQRSPALKMTRDKFKFWPCDCQRLAAEVRVSAMILTGIAVSWGLVALRWGKTANRTGG